MADATPLPLAQLTTLRTGGTPARMIDARTREELVDALRDVWADGGDWFVLGGGSNLLVGDEDYDGTVVRVLTRGIRELPAPDDFHVRVQVEAGHGWDDFVAHVVARGWAGVEALSGIPGTVGAAPVQNVGAYGQEVVQSLVEVELLDEATGEVSVVPASELGLGFRTSVLKHHYGSVAQRSAVIVTATFQLRVQGDAALPVPGAQLRTALGLAEDEPVTLAQVRARILQIRARKGMVLDEADPDTHSAGSFFQNAVITEAAAGSLPDACPRWPVHPDPTPSRVIPLSEYDGTLTPAGGVASEVKVSSAWLIEHSGFSKGYHLPRSRAALSTKHALALTNRGGASAEELAELARYIRVRVLAEYGLMLQPEPVLVNVEL